MRKNYTFGILFLVFGLLNSFCSFSQNPVANDDSLLFFYNICGFDQQFNNSIINNDSYPNGIDYQSIDINLTEPGVQNSTIVNGYYISVDGWGTIYGSFNGAYNLQFQYTFKDNLGNTSNAATVSVDSSYPYAFLFSTNTTCDNPMSGSIVFELPYNNNILSQDSTFKIELIKEGILQNTYFTPPNVTSYTISGLTTGGYYVYIYAYCGGFLSQNQPVIYDNSVYIYQDAPLAGNTIPTYVDYNNSGYVDAGDVVNFQYNITNTSSSCILNNVEIKNSSSQGYYYPIGLIPTINPGYTDNSITRTVVINQQNVNNNSVVLNSYADLSDNQDSYGVFFNTTVPLAISNGIKLNAFIDTNNNGIQDGSELDYTNGTFSYEINNGEVHNVNTNSGELYLYESNPANIYNLTYDISPVNSFCGAQYTIATSSYSNITVLNGSGITTYNFPITIVPCADVSVNLLASSLPRPSFNYRNTIVLKNDGNQVASGTLTFIKDSAVSIIGVNENIISTPSGFIHDFTNLQPGETRTIIVTMQVPTIPTVSLGQLLTNSVTITPTDANMSNDSASLTQLIVGSYDPNDKTESHGGKILHSSFTANDYLNYTIRFENTGTAEAINIEVEDVLDSKLDETSIRMIASSHPYVLDRVGSNLKWNFNGVNLPPSVPNTQTGHGYIVFQVKPKPGFAIGDVIPNTANIYFDFNPAIVTNTCTTEFVSTLSNENFTFNNFKSFPNPVKNSLTISNASPIETIEISSILGQKMLSKKVNDIQTEIDLSQLSKGIYFVKVTSQGNEKTIKVVKE